MNYPQQPPPPQQGQGMSTTKIVLIVIGVVLFSFLCTCGAMAYRGYSAYKEVSTNLADGGLALSSPPAVLTDLAGAKKDYVGAWTSTSGPSTLEIFPNGHMIYHRAEGQNHEDLTAPIASFSGNDMEVHFGVRIMLRVKTPPHKNGDKWEMVVDNITFQRAGI